MKIAIISSGFFPVVDGVTISALQRLHKLSQWGHQVLFFCPDYSQIESIYPNWRDYSGNILPGVRVVNVSSTPFMDIDFERNVSWSSYKTILKELQIFQPDLVHVDEPERLFLGFLRVAGIDFAKRNNIPCVSFYRTHFLDYLEDFFALPSPGMALMKFAVRKLLCWVYNSYAVTLVPTILTQQKLKEIGIKNTQYEVLTGFDLEKFLPARREEKFFENKYKLPDIEGKIKLIFVGRLTPDKGWNFTMKAFNRVVEEINPEKIALIIVGDGPMREEIANKLGNLVPNTHFIGRVPPDDMPALFANSDIHVTTSEKENKGLTIIEAFGVGIPAIAPRAGGVMETIRDGWNGFLFVPQDEEDFTQKLKILVENPKVRQEMGKRGKEDIAQYGWDNAIANLVKVWEQQIAQK